MPRPLDMKALEAMEAAASELAKSDPAVYVAHLFFSRLGLRNIEIVNARLHWIDNRRIGIVDRPEEDFFPKGCEGWAPIAADVLEEILRFQPHCVDGYLVPGANRTERHHAVYRRHSNWVSHWIKIEPKRVMNCVAMRGRDCSIWAQRFSTFVISCGTAMYRQLRLGTRIVCRIVSFVQ